MTPTVITQNLLGSVTDLSPASRDNTTPAANSDVQRVFGDFFGELQRHGIAYVILHGYERFPEEIDSDIDYAVGHADLPRIRPLLGAVARRHGWVLAQTLEHQLYSTYCVVIDPDQTVNHLKLDVCSHYIHNGCLLLRDSVLLEGRRQYRKFSVPSPSSEFIYVLAKLLGKDKAIGDYLPRLRELWLADLGGAQRRFTDLLGETGRSLDEWFREPPEAWRQLRMTMNMRNRFGPALRAGEGLRLARRIFRPTGIHIAMLGPDGAGKSTLIENLCEMLAPCFGKQRVFKFRPDVFRRIKPGIEPNPHGRSPRGKVISWAKVCYYFADWWLGWLLFLLPARIHSALILFDRDFDDIGIDQKRYLIQGSWALARALRLWVPKADATFILEADSEAIHARKPELTRDELDRQKCAFRRLAETDARYHLVCADKPAEEVARTVSHQILRLMAARAAPKQK